MHTEQENQNCYHWCNILCELLDFLADPAIEEKMRCSLDCCVLHQLSHPLKIILEDETKKFENILGNNGLELIKEFNASYEAFMYSDEEEGFSKKAHWVEFREFSKKVSDYIKQQIKDHKKSLLDDSLNHTGSED